MIIRSVIDLETPISGFPERSSIDEVVAFINEKLDEAMSEGGLHGVEKIMVVPHVLQH